MKQLISSGPMLPSIGGFPGRLGAVRFCGRTGGSRPLRGLCLTALFVLTLAGTALAFPGGELDDAFGTAGVSPTGSGSDGPGTSRLSTAIAPDSASGVVVAGILFSSGQNNRWIVTRMRTDGSPDPTFGTGGKVVLFGTLPNEKADDVALDPSGRIYVSGLTTRNIGTTKKPNYQSHPTVVRLMSNGSIDSTWGVAGVATASMTANLDVTPLALQTNGAVLVATRGGSGVAVARFTSSGQPDLSYGGTGSVTWPVPGGVTYLRALAVDSSNRLYLAPWYVGPTNRSSLMRLTASGALDATFPIRNVTADFTMGAVSEFVVHGLTMHGGDGVVVSGRAKVSDVGTPLDTVLARYTSVGAIDTSFGAYGLARTQRPGEDNGRKVVALSDGRLVASLNIYPTHATVARFLANGMLDTTYGQGGFAEAAPLDAKDLSVDGSGRTLLLVSGSVARYLP